MAHYAYFSDLSDGSVVEWRDVIEGGRVRAARGIRNDGCGNVRGYVDGLGWVQVTRSVEMKACPSRHICDARCLNATGRTMRCECSCGGRNHGRGAIIACSSTDWGDLAPLTATNEESIAMTDQITDDGWERMYRRVRRSLAQALELDLDNRTEGGHVDHLTTNAWREGMTEGEWLAQALADGRAHASGGR